MKKACQTATHYQELKVYKPSEHYEFSLTSTFETNIEFIEIILSANPKILDGMTKHDLKCLCESTALFFLFGPNKASENLLEGFLGIPRFNKEDAKKMMLFYAYLQSRLTRAKRAGIKKASVLTTGCSCDSCLAIADKIMPLDKLPELLYSGCTNDGGCRCRLKFEIE